MIRTQQASTISSKKSPSMQMWQFKIKCLNKYLTKCLINSTSLVNSSNTNHNNPLVSTDSNHLMVRDHMVKDNLINLTKFNLRIHNSSNSPNNNSNIKIMLIRTNSAINSILFQCKIHKYLKNKAYRHPITNLTNLIFHLWARWDLWVDLWACLLDQVDLQGKWEECNQQVVK